MRRLTLPRAATGRFRGCFERGRGVEKAAVWGFGHGTAMLWMRKTGEMKTDM